MTMIDPETSAVMVRSTADRRLIPVVSLAAPASQSRRLGLPAIREGRPVRQDAHHSVAEAR
jgi:hypothetical protein